MARAASSRPLPGSPSSSKGASLAASRRSWGNNLPRTGSWLVVSSSHVPMSRYPAGLCGYVVSFRMAWRSLAQPVSRGCAPPDPHDRKRAQRATPALPQPSCPMAAWSSNARATTTRRDTIAPASFAGAVPVGGPTRTPGGVGTSTHRGARFSTSRVLASLEPRERGLEDLLRCAAGDEDIQVAVARELAHLRAGAAIGARRRTHAIHPCCAHVRAREGEHGERCPWRPRRGT